MPRPVPNCLPVVTPSLLPARGRTKSPLFFLQRELVLSQKTDSLGGEKSLAKHVQTRWKQARLGVGKSYVPQSRWSPRDWVSLIQQWPYQWVSCELWGLPWLQQGDLGSYGEQASPWRLGPPPVASNHFELMGGMSRQF